MKVGTDGVLLGAWATVKGCCNLLDVGTGSGLIALMLAQRNSNAVVTAIDIDEAACCQAIDNVKASPFAERVSVVQAAFQQFAGEAPNRYDLIVSNPPFFTRSLLPPDAVRADARHSVSLSLDALLQGAERCLSPKGHLAMILPSDRLTELVALSKAAGFALRRLTRVVTAPGKPVRRILVEFTKQPGGLEESELLIEEKRHHYSPQFTRLVADFYLDR